MKLRHSRSYASKDGAEVPRALHAVRVSMKYSRRSKRGGRRTEEIKCSDTSMVKNKEDFMKILGLQMKKQEKVKDTEEADAMIERKNDTSTTAIRIRDCSVVIIGENCKICGLLLKCSSDVAFHVEMRHGNGFIIFSNYIEANIFNSIKRTNMDVRRRKRKHSNNNNDNKLLLTLKIGREVISEISIDRKHLKTRDAAKKTETSRRGESGEESITLKNDYKSSVVGIDSFVSKNHCDDYVISVQPFNRTHQRASRGTLLFEGSQRNSNGNNNYVHVDATLGIAEMNSTNIDSLRERLHRWSLQRNDVTCNNNNNIINYNNNNNNNKGSNIKDSSVNECNMSDKENESRKKQPTKNIMDVNALMQGKTNVSAYQMDNDTEEIQEILHTVKRKRINNRTNVKRKFEYHGDSMLSNSEEEIVGSSKKICLPTYSILMASKCKL